MILTLNVILVMYYSSLLHKHENDLIWKILHGSIPTGRFLYSDQFSDSLNCKFCGDHDEL